MTKKWYVAHTISGHEQKARKHLESEITASGMADMFGGIIIPLEEVVEMKQGKRSTSQRKFLPSYILIEMELNRETASLVTNTPGITNFVGSKGKPEPLRETEVERILQHINRSRDRDFDEIPFKEGDPVKVVDGPFTDFSGTIGEVTMERKRVKVLVSIFGRPTPVELDFLQVQSLVKPTK